MVGGDPSRKATPRLGAASRGRAGPDVRTAAPAGERKATAATDGKGANARNGGKIGMYCVLVFRGISI